MFHSIGKIFYFTRNYDEKYEPTPFDSRKRRKEQALWQRRFWEHLIRDDEDFKAHIEYIHFNPVKHGLVTTPRDWEFSSFHKYIRNGED